MEMKSQMTPLGASPHPDPVPPAPFPVPQPITPSKTERMHPDDPNLCVQAMSYPSDYFVPHGSHTLLVDCDHSISWGNAGKNYFEVVDTQPLTVDATTTLNYDWIMAFSPLDGDMWWMTGINFGYNGVCHTITNRQLMLGDTDADVGKAPMAFISQAIFGKYGMGIEDLKKRLTDTFKAASKISKQQDGALERTLARIDYPLSEDLDAWHRTVVVLCMMPLDRFNHPDIDTGYLAAEVQKLKDFREQFYLNHAKDLPRRQFQQTLATHMLNMVNGLLGYMRRQNYITAGEFSKYLDTAQHSINRMFRVLELQNQAATDTGKFIPDLALQLLLTDAATTVSSTVEAANRKDNGNKVQVGSTEPDNKDTDFTPDLPDFNPDLSGIVTPVSGGPKPGPDPGPVPPFPEPIIPIKPEHLHPDVPLYPLEAYAIPSSYFLANGSHAFVVSLDRSICWPCAGRCWYDTSKGEDKTRVRVAQGNAYYDWLMLFHPPEKLYDSVGIHFGYNGVCHTIANRILLVCVETIDVQKAKQADVSAALFGKLGLGRDELKQILTNTFHEAQKTAGYEESILQAVLAKVDYPISEDVAAWHGTMVEICEMPAEQLAHTDLDQGFILPEIQKFMSFREDFYKNNASKMEQFEFQKVLILRMLDIIDRMLEWLRDHNYITPDQFKLYAKNASRKLRLGSAALGLQAPIIAKTGRFDEEMTDKLAQGEVVPPEEIAKFLLD